ncbi:reverse transcriptase domain, reverse transcriptase zinc-binding domain protein, partial [Tanacetum coccineum]
MGGGGGGGWCDIARIGEEINRVGIEFTSSCVGLLGDGRDIRFWVDRWVDNKRLCDRFPRLYHFDRRKEGSVMEKGSWVNDVWCWEWDWVRNIRGRVNREFEDLLGVVQNIVVHSNCRDKWRWTLNENGEFTVKELARLVEEKILHTESGGHETLWNILVPKKVNIFVWRAIKGRLPVLVELDKRGIDLDSVLCPCCNNSVETCAHCLCFTSVSKEHKNPPTSSEEPVNLKTSPLTLTHQIQENGNMMMMMMKKMVLNGEKRLLLQDAEGVLIANIGSYIGGVDLWQNENHNNDNFDPQSMHDKRLEVVSISGSWHLEKLQ